MRKSSSVPEMLRRQAFLFAPAIVVTIVVAMLLVPSVAVAQPVPGKIIRGYIRDSAGHYIDGASVTVNIRKSDNTIRDSWSGTSGMYSIPGYYTTPATGITCYVGDTIEVIASYQSEQEPAYAVANSVPVQFVDVTFDFEISQLGSLLGFLVSGGAIAVTAIAILTMRRRP